APFIVFNIKNNMILGNLSFIILSVILSLVVTPSLGILFLIIFIPLIMTMSYLINKESKNKDILFFSTIAFFISIIVLFAIANSGDVSIGELIESKIEEVVNTQIENVKQLDIKSDQVKEIEKTLTSGLRYLFYIFPAVLLISSSIFTYINYKIVAMGLDRLDMEKLTPNVFRRFRLPTTFFMGTVFIYFIGLGLSSLNLVNSDIIVSNILVLASFFILVQGLSVVDFFLTKRKVFSVLKVLVMCIFIFIPTMVTITYLIGIIDMIFNIRRI
ncbi:MAG TPA: DUF2232 domain-containing protein, partial [Tissierellaceae bacterium]